MQAYDYAADRKGLKPHEQALELICSNAVGMAITALAGESEPKKELVISVLRVAVDLDATDQQIVRSWLAEHDQSDTQ